VPLLRAASFSEDRNERPILDMARRLGIPVATHNNENWVMRGGISVEDSGDEVTIYVASSEGFHQKGDVQTPLKDPNYTRTVQHLHAKLVPALKAAGWEVKPGPYPDTFLVESPV